MSVRTKKSEFVMAILYTFRFSLKMLVGNDGNYDLVYLLAIYAALYIFINQSRRFFINLGWAVLFCIIWWSTCIGGPIAVSSIKSAVYITKMMVCIYLFVFVRDRIVCFDLQSFISYSAIFLSIQTVCALLQRNSELFWRISENRMELLFLEPSELGVFVGVLILLQLFLIKENKTLKNNIANMVSLCAVLILSNSLSGILYTVFTCAIYLIFDKESNEKGKRKKNLFFLFLAIVGITLMLSSDNYISKRFFDALNGTDSSFNTRSNFPMQTVNSYFARYGFWGFGFGNMNTISGMRFFGLRASNYVICASYFLFAIEGGIIAVIIEAVFTFRLLIVCLKSESAFHLAMFVFLFFYMYLGGYATNPVVWILYAIMYTGKEKLIAI